MKIAFYCTTGGRGYGFILPRAAEKLSESLAEHKKAAALEKIQAQAKNFCRVLDIRVTEVMEPYAAKPHVTPSPKYYSFRDFATPAISIPLQNFRRLERRKTGKIAPKSYSCHRDSVSRAVADRRVYTAPKCNRLTALVRRFWLPVREWKFPVAAPDHRSLRWSHPYQKDFPEWL